MHRDRARLGGRAGRIERCHREGVARVGGEIRRGIGRRREGRDLLAVFEDRVASDDRTTAGHARCVPAQRRGRARRRRGGKPGRHGRNRGRGIGRRDDGPRLTGAEATVVVRGIGALRPPICVVGDAVLRHGHAGGVDAARGPSRRAARRRNGGRRRRGGRRRAQRRASERALPGADRGGVLCDDVGEVEVAQRGVLQRVGLMVGRDRDDDRPVDLADGELVGCKPAEIEYVGCGIEIDTGIGAPIPNDIDRAHGTPPCSTPKCAPLKSGQACLICARESTARADANRAPSA